MPLTRTMSIKEFCDEYRVGTTRLYEEVKCGRIRLRKLGRKSLIVRDEAERWLKNLPISGADRGPSRRMVSR
jgi:excisionase family DNA binding protein